MDPLTIVILALATARITTLVVQDAITEPIRHRIFLLSPPLENPDEGELYYRIIDKDEQPIAVGMRDPGFFGQVVSCVHCAGVWIGTGVWGLSLAGHIAMTFLSVVAVIQLAEIAVRGARS